MCPPSCAARAPSACPFGHRAFAREKLFDPLGIPTEPAFEPTWDFTDEAATEAAYEQYYDAEFAWGKDPAGPARGRLLHHAPPAGPGSDRAAVSQRRRLGRATVVSAEWVEQATAVHVERHDAELAGYGYLWWITDVADEPRLMAYGLGAPPHG